MKSFTGLLIEESDLKDPAAPPSVGNMTNPDASHAWWQAEMVIHKSEVLKYRFGPPALLLTEGELEAHVRDSVLEKLKRPVEEAPWYIKLCKGYTWGMVLVGSLFCVIKTLDWLHSLGY